MAQKEYPELTLKQKNVFLDWAIKEMTEYTVICIMFNDWYNQNIKSKIDMFYCMVSFPELIEIIIQRIKRQGGDVILNHKDKIFSVSVLFSGLMRGDKHRINLLKQVKKQINGV